MALRITLAARGSDSKAYALATLLPLAHNVIRRGFDISEPLTVGADDGTGTCPVALVKALVGANLTDKGEPKPLPLPEAADGDQLRKHSDEAPTRVPALVALERLENLPEEWAELTGRVVDGARRTCAVILAYALTGRWFAPAIVETDKTGLAVSVAKNIAKTLCVRQDWEGAARALVLDTATPSPLTMSYVMSALSLTHGAATAVKDAVILLRRFPAVKIVGMKVSKEWRAGLVMAKNAPDETEAQRIIDAIVTEGGKDVTLAKVADFLAEQPGAFAKRMVDALATDNWEEIKSALSSVCKA
jgi:hypothetical protein